MGEKIKKLIKKHWILVAILLVASFLMFYRINEVDIIADDAHYATRSVALLDTMFSQWQPTTINWFDELPWWAYLSFHDHPTPLLFVIQHLFLLVNESALFVKLPFTLMALGTIILVYSIVLELFSSKENKKEMAIMAALFTGLSNTVILSGRISHMEGGVTFFVLLAIYLFIKFTKERKKWLWFGLALGAALLTKYNALFILPALLLAVIILHRSLFKDKRLYYAGLVAIACLTPIIIYNVMLYKTRGHLDVQLSRLFGLENPWPFQGTQTSNKNILEMFTGLGGFVSYPYMIAAILAVIYSVKKYKKMWLIASHLIFLFVFIFLVGYDPRFLILAGPFLGLSLGVVVGDFTANQNLSKKKILYAVTALFSLYIIFFLIRSHTFLVKEANQKDIGWTISSEISENFGFSQLDSFLDTYVADLMRDEDLKTVNAGRARKAKKTWLAKYNDSPNKVQSYTELNHIFIYDDELLWFPRTWIFERRLFYHNLPFFDVRTLFEIQTGLGLSEWPEFNLHLIKGAEGSILQEQQSTSGSPEQIREYFESVGVEPIEIKNSYNEVAFRIYRHKGEYQFAGVQ